MIDELGLGNNAKGTFITWGWDEAVTLGLALGARAGTFTGLAGVGDLIATCSSNLSRNHFVGCELARGRSLSDISAGMPQVAEGVTTTFVAYKLAETLGLNLPVIELIYRVLFEGLPPGNSFVELQRRIAKQHQLSADAARTSR